jgi:hypothetical protein
MGAANRRVGPHITKPAHLRRNPLYYLFPDGWLAVSNQITAGPLPHSGPALSADYLPTGQQGRNPRPSLHRPLDPPATGLPRLS